MMRHEYKLDLKAAVEAAIVDAQTKHDSKETS